MHAYLSLGSGNPDEDSLSTAHIEGEEFFLHISTARSAIMSTFDENKVAYVEHGSFVYGTHTAESDIDFVISSEIDMKDAARMVISAVDAPSKPSVYEYKNNTTIQFDNLKVDLSHSCVLTNVRQKNQIINLALDKWPGTRELVKEAKTLKSFMRCSASGGVSSYVVMVATLKACNEHDSTRKFLNGDLRGALIDVFGVLTSILIKGITFIPGRAVVKNQLKPLGDPFNLAGHMTGGLNLVGRIEAILLMGLVAGSPLLKVSISEAVYSVIGDTRPGPETIWKTDYSPGSGEVVGQAKLRETESKWTRHNKTISISGQAISLGTVTKGKSVMAVAMANTKTKMSLKLDKKVMGLDVDQKTGVAVNRVTGKDVGEARIKVVGLEWIRIIDVFFAMIGRETNCFPIMAWLHSIPMSINRFFKTGRGGQEEHCQFITGGINTRKERKDFKLPVVSEANLAEFADIYNNRINNVVSDCTPEIVFANRSRNSSVEDIETAVHDTEVRIGGAF